jgi:hypothetical protein
MRARRFGLGLLAGAVLAPVVAMASPSAHGVRLALAHTYRAGQSVEVTVVNDSGSRILHGLCFTLERAQGARWVTVTRTHGVAVPCTANVGYDEAAGAHAHVALLLYDDLRPGRYRITLRYEPVHGDKLANLRGPHVRSVEARLKVLAFRPGPRPTLSEQRILALADQAASGSGDPRPTLIQHAEGTRFEAVRISSGDLIFEWTWSYLIAMRGHFTATGASVPPGAKVPTGSVLTLVVDARTGQVTDSGFDNRYPHLAKLGPVTTDSRVAVGSS